MRSARLLPLDPKRYVSHPLHSSDRIWVEANCYIDVWIEVLHTLGLDPYAVLAFTLAVDFEGDQWTFAKPPLHDLYHLYGILVEELNVWGTLEEHVAEQIARRRLPIVEVDSYFLPDTAGNNYRTEHGKTGIGIQEIDLDAERLGYFHGTGYHTLEGEDFRGIFRRDVAPEIPFLPPYVELAKLAHRKPIEKEEILPEAVVLLGEQLRRRPEQNPFFAYQARFADDLTWLRSGSLSAFHRYAFATLRQLGAAFELAGLFLRWLEAGGQTGLEPLAADLISISSSAKALQFKLARAVNGKKTVDFAATFDEMRSAYARAIDALSARYGG